MKTKLHWLALISTFIVGIVSCIKVIYEPDVWWQIRTGQWIIENNTIPKTDVFSFTFNGEPWINVKWFAEVLMAIINNSFGPEWLIILQIICVIGILFFCYKTTVCLNIRLLKVKKHTPLYGIIYSALIMLFVINFRMNSRPEMFSHLLMIVYLYYLIKYSNTNSNWLLILIPLQIIWTNTHEAFGMGTALILIFIFSTWVEHLIYNKKRPVKYTLIGLSAIVSSAINPNGIKMILHPFNIFGQLGENKFTSELLSFRNPQYWQYQAIFMVFIVVVVMYHFFSINKGKKIQNIVNSFGLGYFLTVLAMLYLSLTALRNIPFLIIAITPIIANFINSKVKTTSNKGYSIATGVNLIVCMAIISNVFYKTFLPKEQFGININAKKTPIGAANFIKQNNITGKGFVDYLSSSYLLYSLQPNYKSYIDLRDLDVFNSEFFKNIFTVYQTPTVPIQGGTTLWQYLNSLDTFNYVVLLNAPEFQALNRHLAHYDKSYELVYADGLNSIYLKVNDTNKPLISKYGFYSANHDIFNDYTYYKPSKFATLFNKNIKQSDIKKLKIAYYQYMGVPNASKLY